MATANAVSGSAAVPPASPSDHSAVLENGEPTAVPMEVDTSAPAGVNGSAADGPGERPNPEDRIQRRDSYYWEEDAPEVPVTRVVADNVHWIGRQLLFGIEYVGEIFAEFLNLSQSRYEWALEAARMEEEEEEEKERIRAQRERWAEIQRLKKEEEEAKRLAAANGEAGGAAAPRMEDAAGSEQTAAGASSAEGSGGLLAAVAAAVSSSSSQQAPKDDEVAKPAEEAPKEGNDMA